VVARLARYLLGSFSRVTSRGRTYIPQLDGLRFVAIVWVVAFHLGGFLLCKTGHERLWWHSWNPLIFWAYSGNIGVNLFFGISGFILAMPFAKYYVAGGKPVSLKAYFTRRLTRLEPPYLVHLTVLFLTGGVLGQYLVTSAMPAGYNFLAEATRHLLTSLVYCNWLIYPNTHPYLNGVLWSLEVEVQFYILVPLLTTVFAI
jgi:peptidoglycan/LPS O-acetylase OafA/YrhL